MKVITSPLFRRKKNGTPVASYIQLLHTYSSSFSTWSSKPTLQENEERPPASLQHFEKKHTERLSSKSPFFLNCILVRREWSCKKENDHRPTTQVCVRCFCRHDVLRPNRETKVFMEAAKSHPFLNKKINFQKLYLPCSLGFMFILSSCKSSTIFWVWKWVEFPVCLGGVPCCPRLFVELLFLKASWWWENIALEGKKSVTISGIEDS